MHRFYAEGGIVDHVAMLSEEDVRHATRVLRLQEGDPVEIFAEGKRFAGVLITTDQGLACRVEQELPGTEAALHVTLYQGLPKAEKMEWIVQKAVELGASRVVPVAMSRCVVQLNGKDGLRKQERWQKIAREASKQSGRCVTMEVEAPITMKEMLQRLPKHEAALVPWEEADGYSLNAFHADNPACRDVAVVIGPEGGMSAEEVQAMAAQGCKPVTLGPRILRTETAAITSVAMLMCLFEQMQ